MDIQHILSYLKRELERGGGEELVISKHFHPKKDRIETNENEKGD